MNKKESKHHLFIIHASSDLEQARRVARVIQRLPDVHVTLSGHVAVAADSTLVDELKSQMQNSSAVLFLLTPSSLDSEWATMELGMAKGMRKPVRILQGSSIPLRIPIDIESSKSFNARELENPEVVHELLSTLPARY